MEKVKISAVSYLNSKPFVFGLQHSEVINRIDLSLDMPAMCASKLTSGMVDVGLVPVAAISKVQHAQVISDYCIASSGKVRTVVLLSHVPLNEIRTIVLDYQSRTSVMLVRVLAQYYWKITPLWVNGEPGFIESEQDPATAMVVIGDRVFENEKRFAFCYDLGEAWKEFSGFDFVFACWVANKPLDIDFISSFNKALGYGIKQLDQVIIDCSKDYPHYPLAEYFYKNINFTLDDSKRKGMELFLRLKDQLSEH